MDDPLFCNGRHNGFSTLLVKVLCDVVCKEKGMDAFLGRLTYLNILKY